MPKKARKSAEEYSRQELYALAEKRGVKYRSRMSKEQLFDALGLGGGKKKSVAEAASRYSRLPARRTRRSAAKPAAKTSRKPEAKPTGEKPARAVQPAAPAVPAAPKPSAAKPAVQKPPAAIQPSVKPPVMPAQRSAVVVPPAPAARPAVPAAVKPAAKQTPAPVTQPPAKAAARPVAVAKPAPKPAAKPAPKAERPVELRPAAYVPGMLPPGSVVAPPPLAGATYVDRGPALPSGYGEDRIVALVRDPRCVFVYWELDGGGRERLRRELGDGGMSAGVWVLRLVMVAGERFFDVPVNLGASNWYLHVEPGLRYQVRIGLVLPGGEFREVAASTEVVTPPETVSDVIDEQWMLVREEFDRLVDEILSARAAGGGVGVGASEMLHRLAGIPRRLELLRGAVSSPHGGGR